MNAEKIVKINPIIHLKLLLKKLENLSNFMLLEKLDNIENITEKIKSVSNKNIVVK